MDYATRSLSIEGETISNVQLRETPNDKGHQVVSRVFNLLLLLYFQICWGSSPIDVFDQEGCGDVVETSSAVGVLAVEGRPM